MAFSIAVIMVFGMSIIFFIMLSINKTRTDREEEKQIWSYLKTYRQVPSEAIKDDEQRIRAKLLFMSILGEQVTESQPQPKSSTKVNGKITKLKERRNKSISMCLRVDSYSSETWPRQLSTENIMQALDEDLVTIPSSSGNLSRSNGEGGTEPTTQNKTDLFLSKNNKSDYNENSLLSTMDDIPERNLTKSKSTSKRSGSVPNAKVTSPAKPLPQVASLKIIESLKDDAFEGNKELSQSELETIRARRRKRSGYMPPKLDLLELSVTGSSAPSSAPTTPVNFVIGDDQLLKPPNGGHYQKSTHAGKGQRISGETPRPRLTRRAQSFRFHDRKRSVRRKNSLELPGSLQRSNERLAFQDNEFARSLNCRRHDRQSRISVICSPHNSDSDSSNDIILPAITLPQEKLNESSSEDTDHSDFVQDVMEEFSRRSSAVSNYNGSAIDFAQIMNNRISVNSNDESTSSLEEDLVHPSNSTKENDLLKSVNREELVPLVSDQEVPLEPSILPDPLTLKRSSKSRRSGVINVQYRR
ncbi:hypothetical protein LOTGIDRAFT_171833 [Lottia gigantea]|uniref:Uncharacterized protein n=1 Tax=Lottia gigantea TaxID=225164 RepID=V4BA30_LOTGI|nr:hypothetical protein LOTGIDRAFT_171833 [Lottia gigantea]ESP02632.1 hypothetical protein LOTGIDRAFT_171833 [Lottia gigantea]